MPDDIFDYFGGNSSRKVEPIDKDEMFEDLLPKKAEPEAEGGADSDEEIVEAELAEEPNEPDQALDVVQTGSGAEDPWNNLASSLGLEPEPVPVRQQKKPAASTKRPTKAKAESSANKGRGQQAEAGDSDALGLDAVEKDSEAPAKEVLSEMFVPTESPDLSLIHI